MKRRREPEQSGSRRVQVSLHIDPALWKQIRILAIGAGITTSALVEATLRREVTERT
jgi:hypothetical protein